MKHHKILDNFNILTWELVKVIVFLLLSWRIVWDWNKLGHIEQRGLEIDCDEHKI